MPRYGSLENVISTAEAGFLMNWARPGEIRIADLGHDQRILHARRQHEAAQPRIVEALGGPRQAALGIAPALLAIEAVPLW